MNAPESVGELLGYSPEGEYQWFRDKDGTWGVACYDRGAVTPKQVVAIGMDKTLAAAMTILLNQERCPWRET